MLAGQWPMSHVFLAAARKDTEPWSLTPAGSAAGRFPPKEPKVLQGGQDKSPWGRRKTPAELQRKAAHCLASFQSITSCRLKIKLCSSSSFPLSIHQSAFMHENSFFLTFSAHFYFFILVRRCRKKSRFKPSIFFFFFFYCFTRDKKKCSNRE